MNKLKELINKLCPNGVEYKKLEDCCNILDNERKPVTKFARIKGEYPYYGANGIQDYVSDYIFDGTFVLVGEDGSVINKNGNPVVTWAEGKIWVNNHAHVIKEKENVLLRYLYHYIQTINVSVLIHGNIPKLNQGDFRNLRIAVPPLEVQCEIVHILDDFTLLSAELLAELKARQKQFSYYRECLVNNGGHKIRLDKIVDIYLGLTHTPKYVTSGIKFISAQNTSKDYLDLTNVKYISREEYESITQNAKPKKGDILFTRVGSNLGHPVIVDTDEELCMFVSLGYLRVKDTSKVSIDYIKHWINTENFWNQVRKNVHGSAKVNLNTGWLSKFEISIPNFDEQKKIVNILNVLEKLCNDISEGLPAEIEARQKQYEYYRDKLLTFKELKVNE